MMLPCILFLIITFADDYQDLLSKEEPLLIGGREWMSLPDLNIPAINVKIDTGATVSALHAYDIKTFDKNGKKFVKFTSDPIQNNSQISITSEVEVVGMRDVKSSNGQTQQRVVINTPIRIGEYQTNIDITLADRKEMNYRMLLGRSAMKNIMIDPPKSYILGSVTEEQALTAYSNPKNFRGRFDQIQSWIINMKKLTGRQLIEKQVEG